MTKKYTIKKSHAPAEDLSAPKKQFRIDYTTELNAAQHEAVTSVNGPHLIIAGAGTGKTRTITYRVAYLVELGVKPESILLLTFTRRSSQEMLRRASILLDARCENVAGGTFHSFANRVLRQYAPFLNFESSFSILDQGDAEDVVNLLRTQLKLDTKARRFPRKQTLYGIFSKSANTQMPIADLVKEEYPHFEESLADIQRLQRTFEEYKVKHNMMDYDDLLSHLRTLLRDHPPAREALARRYGYIMVDEYQDTNAMQAEIVRLLSGARGNVMVVGDDAQSIYSFRGASIRNILDFPKQYPGCRIVTLEENYRSTGPILNLTNEILRRAEEGQGFRKELFTRRPGGELPSIVVAENENMQSKFVVQKVLELREQGVPLDTIAILFRSGFLSFDLEIELNKANIPFVKFGGFKFVETAHVKDLTAYLRVLENPRDAVAWNRILLLVDGVGPRTAEKVIADVLARRVDSAASANPGMLPAFRGEFTGYSDGVRRLFDALKDVSVRELVPSGKVEILMKYYLPIFSKRYDDHLKRRKDLEMFQQITERYRSVASLLADMALEPATESVTDISPESAEDEKLILSTIHSAKGLEWHSVFVMYALDGRFPASRAAVSDEAMEEERRLMYVACTRARENLFITYPINIYDRESGLVLSKPSRFIDGMPENLLETWVVDEE